MKVPSSPFRIFNASAGSGKTYTLTQEYLKIVLSPGSGQAFREILAITFTNKAVTELKDRILNSLKEFSEVSSPEEASPLFVSVRESLSLSFDQLKNRAERVLQEVLHNYAFFDVSTIDKFYHRVIRTFSKDLNLSANFEVLMDMDQVLQKAVDALIDKAGENQELTEILIDFALEKSTEDKSWDVRRDLLNTGRILFDDSLTPILKGFQNKTMQDFVGLRKELKSRLQHHETELKEIAIALLNRIENAGLEKSDFNRGYFPGFLTSLAQGNYKQDFKAKWKRNFGTEPLYPSKTPENNKAILDGLLPELSKNFNRIRELINARNFLINANSNMAPFTVMGLLETELERILSEENLLPITRFNTLINSELSDQPAPYIYERLGEKYRHYFVDEFQDTSELQWQNLVPLIGNALEGEDLEGNSGSLVLVGDAKQAIYRWRGGKAEQLMGLTSGKGPFVIDPQTKNLPKNFRSRKEVVEFNNAFFRHISQHLTNPVYADLFMSGSIQESKSENGGFISVEFLDSDLDSETARKAYLNRCLDLVRDCQKKGFALNDICILTRRRKEGLWISNHLIQEGIAIVSSETLLLKNNRTVGFLIALLYHLSEPQDLNFRFELLEYLAPEGPDMHSWISEKLQKIQKYFEETYRFYHSKTSRLPVYEIIESAISVFNLKGEDDAYLIFLLDLSLEVSQSKDSGLNTFLNYWELKQDALSIAAPKGLDAVQLMTIHKSKGLEFPVVIYPFADTEMYSELNAKLWIPVPPEQFNGFSYLQISKKLEVAEYGSTAAEIYLEDREKLELDAFNVLYVAHTRAAECLFILTQSKDYDWDTPKNYGGFYVDYLKSLGIWNPDQHQYYFGVDNAPLPSKKNSSNTEIHIHPYAGDSLTCHIVTGNSARWGSNLEAAQKYGTFLHYALSLIETASSISKVASQLISEGLLDPSDRPNFEHLCHKIVDHPSLSAYFTSDWEVYCERDIILKNGLLLRPDRMLIRDNKAVILDYKTGRPKPEDKPQLKRYTDAVEEMGMDVETAFLLYISEDSLTLEYL